MAQDNIKDFTVEWTIFGLLFFCLLTFATLFMFSNNPIGFNDDETYFLDSAYNTSQGNLLEISDEANIALNITAQTNPEDSYLGSRDSVSIAFNEAGQGRSSWESMKQLIGWTFSGDIGKMLIAVLGGLIGYLMSYFILKAVRTGT